MPDHNSWSCLSRSTFKDLLSQQFEAVKWKCSEGQSGDLLGKGAGLEGGKRKETVLAFILNSALKWSVVLQQNQTTIENVKVQSVYSVKITNSSEKQAWLTVACLKYI